MLPADEFDPALIDRALAGEATAAEQAALALWMAADARRGAVLTALREAQARDTLAGGGGTDAAWQALQARIAEPTVRPITDAPSVRRVGAPHRARWWRVAAVLFVGIVGAMAWRARPGETVLVARTGERISTTLPDGSRMTLAAGSRARWSRRFGSGARDVQLEGEASFDVVHDTTQPFRVHVGRDVAEDVGTKFVVRAWPEIGGVEVAVEEGAVSLGRERARPTLLAAGDRGVVSPLGQVTVARDGAARAAWARGEFAFDGATLREALPALGRWYGVTLTAAPSLQSRRVSGRFTTLPLDQLLDALSLALDARVTRDGAVITLSPH